MPTTDRSSGASRLGRAALVAMAVPALLAACADAPSDLSGVTGDPGRPFEALDDDRLGRFLLGRALFERNTAVEEGLGPLYNNERCSGCHDLPDVGGGSVTTIDKATRWDDGRCDLLEAYGGDNIQQRVTPPLAEALGIVREPFPENANARARVQAPSLFGLGLVEAIPDRTIRALADPDDSDGDGISGRVGVAEDGEVGRFGGKAEFATMAGFTDTALRFEIGLTTPDHPVEETIGGEPLPDGVDPFPEPEIEARGIGLLLDYMRYLAAPAREVPPTEAARDSVARGEALFDEVGCAGCHVPLLQTGPSDDPFLDRKPVPLYSDLLVHDLGPELSGVCGRNASPTEHRTARLWGLRHKESFLHDGRAPSPAEAVQYHGGEASQVRDAFNALSDEDRALLLRFLDSL